MIGVSEQVLVFLSTTYREVLERFIQANCGARGYKSRLAEAAGCHNSYISQVLKGSVDLTLEQAMNLATFWEFDADRTAFFLDLLLRDRAGNERLRSFYERRLRCARENFEPVCNSQKSAPGLAPEAVSAYYSVWYYAAVLVLARTKEYSRSEKIATRLNLPFSAVQEALSALEDWQLLDRHAGAWRKGHSVPHVARGEPAGMANQINWRQRAIFNVQSRDPESLHLQQVFGFRRADIPRIKARLVQCFEDIRSMRNESDPEDGFALVLDCFRV